MRTGRWSASEFDQLGVKWRAGSQLTRRVTFTFDQGKELADHKALSPWM
jgi:IS30 family transposase